MLHYESLWEFEKWGHQMAPFQSELKFTKIHTDSKCQKTSTKKFQLPNIYASGEMISYNVPIICMEAFLNFSIIEKLSPIQMIGNFPDFISRKKNVRKLEFGWCVSAFSIRGNFYALKL